MFIDSIAIGSVTSKQFGLIYGLKVIKFWKETNHRWLSIDS